VLLTINLVATGSISIILLYYNIPSAVVRVKP